MFGIGINDTLKYVSVFANRVNLEKYLWGTAGELPDESKIFGNDETPGITAADDIFTLMGYDLFHAQFKQKQRKVKMREMNYKWLRMSNIS